MPSSRTWLGISGEYTVLSKGIRQLKGGFVTRETILQTLSRMVQYCHYPSLSSMVICQNLVLWLWPLLYAASFQFAALAHLWITGSQIIQGKKYNEIWQWLFSSCYRPRGWFCQDLLLWIVCRKWGWSWMQTLYLCCLTIFYSTKCQLLKHIQSFCSVYSFVYHVEPKDNS